MISSFPVYNSSIKTKTLKEMQMIMDAIKGIRNIRNEMNVPPSKKAGIFIITEEPEIFENGIPFFKSWRTRLKLML